MRPIIYLFFFLIGLHVHCHHLPGHHNDQETDENPAEHQHPPLEEEQSNNAAKCHKIAPSNADFAFRLYRQIASDGAGRNVFFSPLSISTAMAMLSLGAKSETLSQIHKGLSFNRAELEENEIHEGFQYLIRMLNRPKNKAGLSFDQSELEEEEIHEEFQHLIDMLDPLNNEAEINIGNALFIEESLKLLPKFLEDAKTLYESEGFSSNFQNTAIAEKQINDYVQNKTHGKIPQAVDGLDPSTVMVLLNYIFFKGFWEHPFNTESIREEDFFVNADTTVKVNLMYKKSYYKYLHDDDLLCSVVEIPYKGDVSALFILPDERKMQQLENRLGKGHLSKWATALKNKEIRLYIPKFSLSTSYDVQSLLQPLGVKNVFGDNADLSGIVEEGTLKVSRAIHKAVVDVHEAGTEAAAVTVVDIQLLSFTFPPPPPPPVIKYNRPFLFLIYDKITDSIVFFGKVVNPKEN